MSKNSTNNSQSQCKVVSKYFSSTPVMDESLSEFKEKKSGCTGPKNSQNPATSKQRAKKAPKRLKGQKDIRTVLKSKKNELITYSKDFDLVCKKSGLDIDSEQLQLAIALSKSEHLLANDCSTENVKPLSSQERVRRIRTTLQEYGFTIPNVKITSKKQKKKCKKDYKLLLAPDQEKKQIVSDKYSQILFENVSISKVDNDEVNLSQNKCYFFATNISYMEMKNNDILYIENLIEKSFSNGSLLRDWTTIPGRPQSPKACQTGNMNFSEIECSQEELDIVLSGTLKSAKSIIHNKHKAICAKSPIVVIEDCDVDTERDQTANGSQKSKDLSTEKIEDGLKNSSLARLDPETNDKLKVSSNNSFIISSERIRSCSPDIFDDEVSEILDHSELQTENHDCMKNVIDSSEKNERIETSSSLREYLSDDKQEKESNTVDLTRTEVHTADDVQKYNIVLSLMEESNESDMGLTETNCDAGHKNNLKCTSPIFQISNVTKRKSNDFMEITECIPVGQELGSNTSSMCKSISSQVKNRTRRMTNDLMEITECVGKTQHVDLTQNSDEGNDVTNVNMCVNSPTNKVVDISQSSHSDDDLPFVQISGSNNHSLDETILLDSDEIKIYNNHATAPIDDVIAVARNNSSLDLVETPTKTDRDENEKFTSQHNQSELINNKSKETFDVQSSGNSSEVEDIVDEIVDLAQPKILSTSDIQKEVEIDLTQSYLCDNAEENRSMTSNICSLNGSLGKKDEVSIDYDEMFDNISRTDTNANSKSGRSSHQSTSYDVSNDNDKESENQTSEIFNISDKELEYSLHKSRNDIPWDVENMNSENEIESNSLDDNQADNKSMSDSYLPVVNIKKYLPKVTKNANAFDSNTVVSSDKSKTLLKDLVEENNVTPSQAFRKKNAFAVDTPINQEYIVKTNQVTPMLDYASMSSPERNKELDKYGLKPFKRKRAIQLLTHLYNQTHPVVQSCPEGSPSKKRRYSSQLSPIKSLKSPNKFISPEKRVKSSKKSSKAAKETQNENSEGEDSNLYELTNELPVIKDFQCAEEDWVFQKREKAKLHSCRVPLHIALHNYVTCRRKLHEAVLKYEPVNIDIIHKELVASGHRYDPKDLLKYMDKKCITVKTADNNARNKR